MNTKLPWMILAAGLLAACDEKTEPAAAAPESKSTQPFPTKRAETRTPAAPPEVAPVPEAAPPAIAGEAAAAAPPVVPPAAPAMTAEEREARRAEQREQRIARMTEQVTARLKERDTNGDGMLAKDEVSGRMGRGFDRADTNGDGMLDAAEQEAMIQSMTERMADFDRRDRGGRFGGGGNFGGRGNFGEGRGPRRQPD
ncbi:hypothetical protein [Luteolibacter marinus]|uniref:hypothetical protein n=1 Tax=Luteolibacter marinus TaxID=2776705 RepID=UPI001868992F|nr:hypothetical protein [Luteolibacter marinus]